MLITEMKSKDSILSLAKGKTVVICCEGCKEVYFPETEAAQIGKELADSGAASAVIVTDYICNPENQRTQLQKYMDNVNAADTLLVFSCGVGVQTTAEIFADKKVYAGCDTYPVPGDQGVTPIEYECDQCGECHLNSTGGICPITACSKSLVNGQCGGAKAGKCEVDKDMDCGWELIFRRLEKLELLEILRHPTKTRNFSAARRTAAIDQ